MTSAATLLAKHPLAFAAAAAVASSRHGSHHPLLHFLFQFGIFGLVLVSTVDSSFVPLPIPGITDIMIIVFAAEHANWLLLVLCATLGSGLGGYFSYRVGHSGGMSFLEKRVPPRIFKRVTRWMDNHPILSVALPAILPPPMTLSPFVLAAGALNMSRNRFLYTFTLSRALRHAIAVWLGIHYGREVIHLWNRVSDKYATTILSVLWTGIFLSCAYAGWQLYKTSRTLRPQPTLTTPEATV